MPCPINDPITIAPDLADAGGKAWRVDLDRARQQTNARPDATVACWIIEAPWAHPWWHSYCLYVLHLRPAAGVDNPTMHLAGATHELGLWALNPDRDRNELLDFRRAVTAHFLSPINFAAQFKADSDEAATEKALAAVKRVTEGTLSPDTDFVRHWAHLFGDNMLGPGAGETRIEISGPDGRVDILIPPHKGPQDLH